MRRPLQFVLFLAALAWCAPAHAALTCTPPTTPAKACSSAASCAQAYSTNPSAGDLLLVHGDVNNTADTLTIASTLDGAWHQMQASASPVTGTGIKTQGWWVVAAGGGADTVTISGGDVSHNIVMVIVRCSGFTGTPTEDQGAHNSGISGVNETSGTTSATTQANEIVWASFGSVNANITLPAGYTLVGGCGSSCGVSPYFGAAFYAIVSSTGAQSATSGSATGNWAADIDTFYDAASGTSTPTRQMFGLGQ